MPAQTHIPLFPAHPLQIFLDFIFYFFFFLHKEVWPTISTLICKQWQNAVHA